MSYILDGENALGSYAPQDLKESLKAQIIVPLVNYKHLELTEKSVI
jgi:hypothetical protein